MSRDFSVRLAASCRTGILLILICFSLIPWTLVFAETGIISSNTHHFSWGGDPQAITIEVIVHNNFEGNAGRYQWIYRVTNNSYNPRQSFFSPTGFADFYIELGPDELMWEIENVSAPGSNWGQNGWYAFPFCWDVTSGQGVMPGQTGDFSFTTLPREAVLNGGGFCSQLLGAPGFEAVIFNEANGLEGPGSEIQVPQVGTCCLPDGTCTSVTQGDCETAGGVYMGPTAQCGDCVGDCVAVDGTCSVTTADDCASGGGHYCGRAVALYVDGVGDSEADKLFDEARQHLADHGWRVKKLPKPSVNDFVNEINSNNCIRGLYVDAHGYANRAGFLILPVKNSIKFSDRKILVGDLAQLIPNHNFEFVSTATCYSYDAAWKEAFPGVSVYVAAEGYKGQTVYPHVERYLMHHDIGETGVDDDACDPNRIKYIANSGGHSGSPSLLSTSSGCQTFAICDSTGCGHEIFPAVSCRDSLFEPSIGMVDLVAHEGEFTVRIYNSHTNVDSLEGAATLMAQVPSSVVKQDAYPLNRYLSYSALSWPMDAVSDSVVVTLAYTEDDLSQGRIIEETDIGVYWISRGVFDFQVLPSSVDTVANTVTFSSSPAGFAGLYNLGDVSGVPGFRYDQGGLSVQPCFPNPFNPTTNIVFEIPRADHVEVAVHDIGGRLIDEIFEGHLPAGRHEYIWRGTDIHQRRVGSGVYFVSVKSGVITQTQRVVLLK